MTPIVWEASRMASTVCRELSDKADSPSMICSNRCVNKYSPIWVHLDHSLEIKTLLNYRWLPINCLIKIPSEKSSVGWASDLKFKSMTGQTYNFFHFCLCMRMRPNCQSFLCASLLVQLIFFKFYEIAFSLLFTLTFTRLLLLFSLSPMNYHCHSNYRCP